MIDQDYVEIEARNRRGEIITQMIIPFYEWYESETPIIDSEEERIRLGIAYILGKQFTSKEGLIVHWITLYDEAGAVAQGIEWRSDGSKDVRFCSNGEITEHIHTPPPNVD